MCFKAELGQTIRPISAYDCDSCRPEADLGNWSARWYARNGLTIGRA